jgi:hypothetical protein
MEKIEQFATRYKALVKPDRCDDPIILGKNLSSDSFLASRVSRELALKRRETRRTYSRGITMLWASV